MLPAKKGYPVPTSADPNTETFIYIKYGVTNTIPDGTIILPPKVEEWSQLCMYLGHPSLRDNERDFIYGGSAKMCAQMVDAIVTYFEELLSQNIVESYDYDVADNEEYVSSTGM